MIYSDDSPCLLSPSHSYQPPSSQISTPYSCLVCDLCPARAVCVTTVWAYPLEPSDLPVGTQCPESVKSQWLSSRLGPPVSFSSIHSWLLAGLVLSVATAGMSSQLAPAVSCLKGGFSRMFPLSGAPVFSLPFFCSILWAWEGGAGGVCGAFTKPNKIVGGTASLFLAT